MPPSERHQRALTDLTARVRELEALRQRAIKQREFDEVRRIERDLNVAGRRMARVAAKIAKRRRLTQ